MNAVNRVSWTIGLGLLMTCLVGPAQAVTIDDFSDDQGPLSLMDPADAAGDTAFDDTTGSMIGSERTWRLLLLSVAASEGTTVQATGGQLVFSVDAGSRGQVDVGYDGQTGDPNSPLDVTVGLGGVDLTVGNHSGLRLSVGSSSVAGAEVELEVHSSVTQSSKFVLRLPLVAAAEDFICSFSDFFATGSGGGADFTAVTAIVLRLRGSDVSLALDGLETVGPQLLQANVLNTDTLIDSDLDGFADPGETVKFTITLSNTGAEAQSIDLGDMLDANVTGQNMTLFTTPIAQRDSYQSCGNVSLVVDAAAGVLANDSDPDGDSTLPDVGDPILTVTATDTSQTLGSVVIDADGGFTYSPPAGFQGIDTFGYTVTDDDGRTSTGQAVVSLESLLWFLDDDDGSGPFEGTQSNPFNDLLQAQAASGPGDILYVVSDNGIVERLTQSIVLKDDQQLIGGGVALEDCGLSLAAGSTPGITDTTSVPFTGGGKGRASGETLNRRTVRGRGGARGRGSLADKGIVALPVVTLANRNVIRGIELEATQVAAIEGSSITGLTVQDTIIERTGVAEGIIFDTVQGVMQLDNLVMQGPATTSTGLLIFDSAADIDFNNATFTPGGGALVYAETDASSLDFTGGTMGLAAGASFPAIELIGNSGTYNFATLGAIVTSDAGITADNGGTFTVPATATVTSTGGPALVAINGTNFGVDPLIFSGLAASGTTNGITLANVGQGLSVNGPVTIASTGSGIVASNTGTLTMGTASNSVVAAFGPVLDLASANVSLVFDTLTSSASGAEGIDMDAVTGSVVVTNAASSIVNGAAAAAVDINGGSGTFTYAGSITENGTGSSVSVQNRTSGVHTFSGAIDDNGMGIRMASNAGATVTFRGGMALDTGGTTAFSATGGGTVNVCPTAQCSGGGAAVQNDIGATTALTTRGLEISGTTIGGEGVTFRSISVDGGGLSAIRLADTGSGLFNVTGTGSTDASGGTIENLASSDAIILSNTDGRVTLRNLLIEDIGPTAGGFDVRSQHDGIHGAQIDGGLTLDNVTIRRVSDMAVNGSSLVDGVSGTVWNGLEILNSTLELANRYHVAGTGDTSDEGLVRIVGIRGTVRIDNSTLQDGGELVDFFVTAGNLDMTVTGSNFNRSYKEFNSGPVASIGKLCIDVTMQNTATSSITIGDLADPALGNDFLNCRVGSIRIANDTGASGNIEAIVARNSLVVNDHSSGVGGDFDFPQGGISFTSRGNLMVDWDVIVSRNTFDEIANADGAVGQLSFDMDGGVWEARVDNNTFDTPGNAPWFVRADGNDSASFQFLDNTYIRGFFTCPDASCGGGYFGPGLRSLIQVQNGGNIDFTMNGDDLAEHDVGFDPGQTMEAQIINVGGGGNMCLHLLNNTSPHGYSIEEETGTLSLFQGASGTTGTCSGGAPANCTSVVDANNNTGGGGNPATDPPFVNVVGTIDITGSACSLPSGGIF